MLGHQFRKVLMMVLIVACALAGAGAAAIRSAFDGGERTDATADDAAALHENVPRVLLLADASPAVPEPATQSATTVAIDNFAFFPATLTISAGGTVTWVNHDDIPHTAASVDKVDGKRIFNSGALDTDQKFSFTFNKPGTYAYFCAVHPHMTGTIIVQN